MANGHMKLNEFKQLNVDEKLNHMYENMVSKSEFTRLKIKVYGIGFGIIVASGVLKWVIP